MSSESQASLGSPCSNLLTWHIFPSQNCPSSSSSAKRGTSYYRCFESVHSSHLRGHRMFHMKIDSIFKNMYIEIKANWKVEFADLGQVQIVFVYSYINTHCSIYCSILSSLTHPQNKFSWNSELVVAMLYSICIFKYLNAHRLRTYSL